MTSYPKERLVAKDLLNPSSSQSLEKEYPDEYVYVSSHTSSGENTRIEQGWTEVPYETFTKAGGMVRNAILSGSYGELKKLKVDSEVNAETVTTSWSSSIGENLRVGNNVGIAGYLNLGGDTASLLSGSSQPGQDPVKHFAPNGEQIGDIRLIVSDSALIQKDLYVNESASLNHVDITGDVDVDGTLKARNLVVSGTSYLHGYTTVGNSLEVSDDIVCGGGAQISAESNFYSSVEIAGDLTVHGTTTTIDTEELTVKDKSITVAASASTPFEANGAGIDIAGANVEFHYDAQKDRMTLNKDLQVVNFEAYSSGTVRGELTVQDILHCDELEVNNNVLVKGEISGSSIKSQFISGTFYGDGSHLTGVSASIASSSTWKSYLDFESESFQRVTHPFKTTDVFVQVYRWDDPNFHPDIDDRSSFSGSATLLTNPTIRIVDTESIDIGYPEAVNGYAVISDAGMMITGSIDVFSVTTDRAEFAVTDPTAIYRFSHKLGTDNIITTFYQYADIRDGYGTVAPVQIFPEQLSIPDNSHIDVVFGRAPIEGYVVIAKAGHVIKAFDLSNAIEDENIHHGTEGNWTANSFTAVSMSTNYASVEDYVDTSKVGSKGSNEQGVWESYTKYTDTGIEEYVKNSNEVRQVSNIDNEGNLKIRGNLTTNGSFNVSDIRKKKDIWYIEDALKSLEHIKGVKFRWKESNEPSIGVIAQDVQTIYPELVKNIKNLDGEEQLTVNYDGLVGVLIEAVKELSTRVKELERQNENR